MPTAAETVIMTLKDWINKQDNQLRIENYKVLDSYYDGDFDQPFQNLGINPQYFHKNKLIADRIKEALGSDFRVIANYAKTIVNKAVGYLCSEPVSIEVKPDTFGYDPKTEEGKKAIETLKNSAKEAERLLYKVYKNNGLLGEAGIELIRLQGKKGDVFVKCYLNRDDKLQPIKIEVLRPDIVFVKFKSNGNFREWEYVAVIFDKTDEQTGEVYKYAQVWWQDIWREYESRKSSLQYTQIGPDYPNELEEIPFAHIKNMADDKPWGESDIEVLTTLIDAMCKAWTDTMVNADYQAFQRILTSGRQDDTWMDEFEKEENRRKGKADVSQGPGTITNIPGQNVTVTVIEPADPQGLLNIIKELRQELATHGRVPMLALSSPDGAGAASSLSLRIHYQPLDEKCAEKVILAAGGLQKINQFILKYHKILNPTEDFTSFDSKVRFSESLPVDELQQSQIQDTQVRIKVKSRETVMQENGIEDIDAEKEKIQEESSLDQANDYGTRINNELNNLLGGDKGTGAGEKEKGQK